MLQIHFSVEFQVISCVFLTKCFGGFYRNYSSLAKDSFAASVFLVTNASLVMVDNIHFQYNGILTSLMLFSLGWIMRNSFLWVSLYCLSIFDISLNYASQEPEK